jgi:predicted ATPase
VTTREVLGLPGEDVIALEPLAPADAATLFLRRAEAAKPEFEPSGEDQAAIPPLVKLLEGLPLAIELAAARVRVMPPRTLLVRMNERFKLLASTGGRLDRQATLRAVFDWSWDLLSLPGKATLAQLSVFEGGFTLESVEAILDLSAYDNAPWPMDALQSLVQKSLVRQMTDAPFELLVSVQEYAAEHLRTIGRYAGSGPAALLATERRHGAHFAGLDASTRRRLH